MNRLFVATAILLASTGCSVLQPDRDSEIAALEASILENQQIQAELLAHIKELSDSHSVSSESIQHQLAAIQEILNSQGGLRRASSDFGATPRSTDQSKADWLKAEGKIIVGGVEHITFTNEQLTYKARIDTGATSSSLDARDITRFERDGKRWVRFTLINASNGSIEVERPIVRWVRIFQSGTDEGERRPVVEMAYQFGDFTDTAEFTLTDRSHLEFPTLVGRNILTDRLIVDVSDNFLFQENN